MSGGWSSPKPPARAAAPAPAGETSVSVARTAAEIAALVPEWEALAGAALEPNPFYESWMLLPALDALVEGEPVFIAAVRVAGQLAGLFPLQPLPRYKGLPTRALRLWRHRHLLLCVPLVRAESAAACLDALLAWAAAEASVLQIEDLPAGGAFHRALIDAIARRDLPTAAFNMYTRAVLRKAADAESYLAAALSTSTRRKLARKARRLAERGAVSHVRLAQADDADAWIEKFIVLEASGWKGERGSALASREGDRRFAVAVLREALRRGRLLALGLDLDGTPIARCSTILAAPGSFAFKTAYAEGYADYSPGVLAELDRMAAFHALPDIAWMDSFTGPNNARLDAMWKDRIAVQTLLVSLSRMGDVVLAAMPAMRLAKRVLRPAAA
ncbi:MAG TPA: GNAT family N-acetyltransferase [Burkholderiales bacterium]|jgi:CelD/BcsL family acetyltransferase involved in cellulose biosynthesis|nr:GNAT family N-acetyltransferase [Burkholderiales bacterium]